jgi:hypothetical protein
MRKCLLLYSILTFLLFVDVCAQGINNRYIYGYFVPNKRARLNFQNSNITIDSTWFPANFATTACNISDSAGNLLFSTNGVSVFNRNMHVMQGGDTLSASELTSYSSDGLINSQGALIVPMDYNKKYYVFTGFHKDWDNYNYGQSVKLQYCIVDLNFNNGLGKVTNLNTTILTDTLRSGGLTVCKHANGRDWWMPIKQWHNNKFYMFLITPQGIQNMGEQALGDTTSAKTDWYGQTAFSPNGEWYANIDGRSDLNLYAFDRCTGQFTSALHLPLIDGAYFGGISFSPNSKIMYATSPAYVFQYNLEAPDINDSKDTVAILDGFTDLGNYTTFGFHQLMNNNKIYISTANFTKYLHVIENPDSLGMACNVNQHGFTANVRCKLSIPNHYNYFLGPIDGTLCDSLGITVGLNTETGQASAPLSLEEKQGVRLIPNPNKGSFVIRSSKAYNNVIIHSIDGKEVYNNKLVFTKGNANFDLDLPNGVYHVKLIGSGGLASQKLVISK